jgi:hypothetical protein
LRPSRIAQQAGVSERTVQNWADDPQFTGAVEQLRAQMLTRCIQAIFRAIDEGDGRLALEMAARMEPELYDPSYARDMRRFAHEKEMAAMGDQGGDERPLPVLNVVETMQGERITVERDEDE